MLAARLTPSKPYWWDGTLDAQQAGAAADLPGEADVVVVGAGLTGVEAARVLAGAGKSVLVLDAGMPGGGASSRNAGMLGRNFKHSYCQLRDTLGYDAAQAYFRELRQAYDDVAALARTDGASMGWRKCGRVVGAMTEPALARLQTEYRLREKELGEEVEFLGRDAVQAEIGSPLYLGGVRIIENAEVHPGMYYGVMLARARAAGAIVIGHTPVQRIERQSDGFTVALKQGRRVRCGHVVMATNGYTHSVFGWFSRRLLPIDSYMLATNPLTPEVRQSLWPYARTYHCNRRRSHFMSFTPDGTRLLFGGRTGGSVSRFTRLVAELREDMAFMFPAMKDIGISHVWTGRCSSTWDLFPHVGVNPDGIHYALGYCFSGNAMAPYLARKMAASISGRDDEARSIFRAPAFPAVPWYARGPWVMPLVTAHYARADRPAGLSRGI